MNDPFDRVRDDTWPPSPSSGSQIRTLAARRSRNRAVLGVGGLLAVCAVALLQPWQPGGSPRNDDVTPPAASASALVPTPAPASPSAPTVDTRCRAAELRASLIQPEGSSGAGQRYAVVRLTNSGPRTCTIHGYGGLELRDAAGNALSAQTRTPGTAVRTVTLAPGRTATAQLHWTVVAGSGDPADGSCTPGATVLAVTPPDETRQLTVPWTSEGVCGEGIEQQAYAAEK